MSDERRQQIIDAARQLYEEQGLARTSVKDISERCGVARSLFYHYFPDKQAVTSAVIDDFITDYLESVQLWDDARTPGDIEQALDGVVKVLRVGVFEHSSFRQALDTRENASLYLDFINRVADRMATFFINATVQDYAQVHPVEIDHVYETFYILILGICGYTRTHRDVPNDVLKDVIAQTLHMQRGSTCAAGGVAGAKGPKGEGSDAGPADAAPEARAGARPRGAGKARASAEEASKPSR